MPYKVPQELLDQFTDETGIDVQYNTGAWDGIASKLVVANQAGTYIADVTEFDWSFTGQFGGNGWYEPLQDVARPEAARRPREHEGRPSPRDGNLYAACYSNDFKISMFNSALFKQAGLDGVPGDVRRPRPGARHAEGQGRRRLADDDADGARPRAASRPGTCSRWRWAASCSTRTTSRSSTTPTRPAYKALQWRGRRAQQRLGLARLRDPRRRPVASSAFTGGAAAVNVLGGARQPAGGERPEGVEHRRRRGGGAGARRDRARRAPSASRRASGSRSRLRTRTARKVFIDWMLKPENQVALYKGAGLPALRQDRAGPTSPQSGDLEGGDVVTEEFDHLQPLFPGGAPKWYSQFSSEAQGLLNAAWQGRHARSATRSTSSPTRPPSWPSRSGWQDGRAPGDGGARPGTWGRVRRGSDSGSPAPRRERLARPVARAPASPSPRCW